MNRASTAEGDRVLFWCPGCDGAHQIHTGPNGWTWNGDLERPTFTPSVLVHAVQWPESEGPSTGDTRRARHPGVAAGAQTICHSFVTDGRIQFLGDCTHVLASQTVDLPEWPYNKE
jgi:hypothetical protein